MVVPVVVGVFALSFNLVVVCNEERRAQAEARVEGDRARAAMLQGYVDGVSNLLLQHGLATADTRKEVSDIARGRTIIAIRDLDPPRISLIMQFLRDSELITGKNPKMSFDEAHLQGANLNKVDLQGVTMVGVFLSDANLSGANLTDALFGGALLTGADLSGADLSGANLEGAFLSNANLQGAILRNAVMEGAILRGAELSDANLDSVDLTGANLNGAVLRGADLSGAVLTNAILRNTTLIGATYESKQLAQAASLVGATLRDGTRMTEARWNLFKELHGTKE